MGATMNHIIYTIPATRRNHNFSTSTTGLVLMGWCNATSLVSNIVLEKNRGGVASDVAGEIISNLFENHFNQTPRTITSGLY